MSGCEEGGHLRLGTLEPLVVKPGTGIFPSSVQVLLQSSPGQEPLTLDHQLALQPALKITRLSSRYICFSEDPAPGNNRRVPGLMSGVGLGGGDTQLPGVITGVLETDAIWSRGGAGRAWAGHTRGLQHLPLSRTSLGPLCPRLLAPLPLGGNLPALLPSRPMACGMEGSFSSPPAGPSSAPSSSLGSH